MKRWILLALLAALLWFVMTGREGFQDTNNIKGIYTSLDINKPTGQQAYDAKHVISLMPASLLTALKTAKPKPCPPSSQAGRTGSTHDSLAGMGGGASGLPECKLDETIDADAITLVSGDIANVLGGFYITVYARANEAITSAQVDGYLATYPKTPFITLHLSDIKTLLVAYFVNQTAGVANTGTNDPWLVNDIAPDPATASPELIARWNAAHGWSDQSASARSALAGVASGYADLIVEDTYNGSLPDAINARTPPGESEGTRPMNGPVFGDNGPFSNSAGTGQGSGMNAAATLTGSSYAHPPATNGRLDAYDFWPGTKNPPPTPGATLPVDGPNWGGLGFSASSAAAAASQPAPLLYGPDMTASGLPTPNSTNTSVLPDYRTTGSDPSNKYAVTSRVPGDQDLYPTPYLQAAAYSIANGSQKTDPVPFLSDFSVFQT